METYTTDDALTAMGFGKFQALVLVYAGTGWLADSMELMLLSFVGPLVRQQWNVSAQHESLLSSVVFTGMLIGACSWGYISDKYGRRTALLFSIILTTGAGFLSALSPNYISLLVFRFLVGIGVGGTHVFSSWFLEFVPAKNRGTWMIVFSVFWTIGTILEASLAWVYPTSARSTGVGIATAIGKIGGIVCPIIAVGMLRSCHQMQAVVVFELVLGLAGVACILFPVETKGREMK
nr:unnamed protein product [Digitaria exilis]